MEGLFVGQQLLDGILPARDRIKRTRWRKDLRPKKPCADRCTRVIDDPKERRLYRSVGGRNELEVMHGLPVDEHRVRRSGDADPQRTWREFH